jgi:hypothetical protein
MAALSELLSISSEPLLDAPDERDLELLAAHAALRELLNHRNGFFAFESALHVIPVGKGERKSYVLELSEWNGVDGWRRAYDLADDLLAFGQDALAVQFLVNRSGAVLTLEPETGIVKPFSDSVEGWAQALLADYAKHTAWTIAHAWQVEHGALAPGWRLMPIVPFVLGGEFEVVNLVAAPAHEVLAQHVAVYRAIKDKPDGVTISWPLTGD